MPLFYLKLNPTVCTSTRLGTKVKLVFFSFIAIFEEEWCLLSLLLALVLPVGSYFGLWLVILA
jgi:hypothetical protein